MADRIYVKHVPDSSLVTFADYGEKGTCAIDQTPAKEFNIDPLTGRPISDITSILRSKDADAERIIKGLTEYKAEFLPADISNEEALKFYQPRLCQLPSELAELNEVYTKKQLDEMSEKKRLEELEKLRADFDKSEDESKESKEESKS